MHHHHPPSSAVPQATASVTGNAGNAPPHQRRRKKRPNYGTRTVEMRRGYNNFGFTISGQQPCRLSCIVSNSPADQAGLRAGDFLISVNGLNVSKLPHETVVQLIGNSFGSIRMQIAENYYSDSSDEENAALILQQQQAAVGAVPDGQLGISTGAGTSTGIGIGGARAKPRYLHHKMKMHRLRNSPQKKRTTQANVQRPDATNLSLGINGMTAIAKAEKLRPLIEELPLPLASPAPCGSSKASLLGPGNVCKATNASDVANVSAIMRVPTAKLEYRAIVGYLGTIEMPNQISHSSKLQTVRSCIRKLRQEKRQPTTILMTILPNSLQLQAANGNVMANYTSTRLNYVSSSSESENRFFGLVTSAVHTTHADDDDDDEEESERGNVHEQDLPPATGTGHISISNSCHVFVIDTKLCEHQAHLPRAAEFRISCTRDCISNLCLEFPNNSEYVVNLIRSMYPMRILPPATRQALGDEFHGNGAMQVGAAAAHSPQPSNHSEISTTTSNSDSGIGFHNDCTNISDRIVVVDFPAVPELRIRPAPVRPAAIFNNFDACNASTDKRLAVRAMPDIKTPPVTAQPHPNLLANFSLIKSPASSLTATRSCDDVLALLERAPDKGEPQQQYAALGHVSMDDISLHSATTTNNAAEIEKYTFLQPSLLVASRKPLSDTHSLLQDYRLGMRNSARRSLNCTVPRKLSLQVFSPDCGTTVSARSRTRHSLGFQAIDAASTVATTNSCALSDTWSSLQDLHATTKQSDRRPPRGQDIIYSEPDLGGRATPTANASPFRRGWVQSSFRTPRTDKFTQGPTNERQQSPLVHRSASMTASDNNVYIKSMGDFICELNQTNSQQQVDEPIGQIMPTKIASSSSSSKIGITGVAKVPQLKMDATQLRDAVVGGPTGVVAWGTSFERLLEDPAGLHNFAEFLKKEFSAENIYFWTACERFRNLENMAERVAQAMTIFSKHLGNGATEPVNVDSQARNLTEDKLQNADRDIFAPAQKQIFNLMKFDSYQRFIRSDLYKSCLEAEEKHQPLPYSADDLDELLRTHFQQGASLKLKKSASNAEDRRRKSLLPWHRKTRSKSRDGGEGELGKPEQPSKLPQLSSSSLKIPSMHNSASDVHSSRSSLCSFDAFPAANGQSAVAEAACTLCRVILSDGATTIVQTRPGETVEQLIERLLEKRGLSYKFYNVVDSETSKSIDLQRAAMTLAGKQVLIEQGVAFKLDLPDPKVISVKSKPKKQLHEVIRPILHKYNYTLEAVRVLRRDTQLPLDLSLPVTVADGQRLQIVLLKQPAATSSDDYQNSCNAKFAKPALQKLGVTFASAVKQSSNASTHGPNIVAAQQATLDEITNKVFNELLQGKVDSHAAAGDKPSAKANDLCSVKSDDCASEGSSIFDRMRRRDTNIPGFKLKSKKKSTSSQHSEESNAASNVPTATTPHPGNVANAKKPIIAKLKAGVRLQVTERVAENQDELLEGLKRAQLARLEDQRGTEINFELPDFLKNKENLSAAASKLRKVRANLSPVSKTPVVLLTPTEETPPSPFPISGERPQPAPRLSIANRNKAASVSPMKIDEENTTECQAQANSSNSSFETDFAAAGARGPPPLPPKPKVLPIKPNNWGVTATTITSGAAGTLATSTAAAVMHTISATMSPSAAMSSSTTFITLPHAGKIGSTDQATTRSAYLEEPSSSFV